MEKTVFRTTLPRAECERALDAALETERTDFEHGGRYRAESPVTGWVMGRTLPPPPPLRAPAELYARSMRTYGTPAGETEENYLKTIINHSALGGDAGETPIGRRKR